MTPAGRRAATGAFWGLTIDFYDIYLPVVAIPPALMYFEPAKLPPAIAVTLFYVVFAVALVGRPIGAFIFGHFGDVIGRKRTTMIAISGFGVITIVMALLPGYANIGWAAIGLLTFLRLVGGIFMGGEYTSANPLAMEACPKHLRGLVGGIIQASFPVAYIAISIVVSIMLSLTPAHGLNSPYVQWGWRIPFVIGGLLAIGFLFYYNRVEESKVWEATAKEDRVKAPLKLLFQGENFKILAQVFLLMSGMWFGVEAVIGVTPVLLINVLKMPARSVTNGILVDYIALAAAYMVIALLAQKYGRRLLLILSGLWTMFVVTIAYYLMVANVLNKGSFVLTFVLAGVCYCLAIGPWGIVTTYINERFATAIRSSGYGIGYSLAVVIPAFYSFYLLWLGKLMPYEYTELVLIGLAGVLVLIGALMGPETKEVDLNAVPLKAA